MEHMILISNEDMMRTAAWLALIAAGEVSDYDLRRLSPPHVEYADGDAKKLQQRVVASMQELRREMAQKRAEEN
jgi:hypothetical protein